MSPEYRDFHEQVRALQNHFHDVVDSPDLPLAQRIRNDLQRLENEVQLSKNPHSVEALIKTILDKILQAQHGQQPIMDPAHSVDFYQTMERLRAAARQLPHY